MSLVLIMLPLSTMQSQDYIFNGDFSKEVTVEVGNPARVKGGEWFFFNVAPDGESKITYTEDKNVKIDNLPGSGTVGWNKVYVGQRLKNVGLEKGVYRVTFEAKGSQKGTQVGVYMKRTVENAEIDPKTGNKYNNFFIEADYDFNNSKHEGRSGALATKRINSNWVTVSFDFCTEVTISAHNSKSRYRAAMDAPPIRLLQKSGQHLNLNVNVTP